MMRTRRVIVPALFALALPVPSSALQASDTMASWRSASSEEKNKLVAAILGRDGRKIVAATIIKCLDEAANVEGHSDLSIQRVAKACEDDGSEPV